MRPDIYFALVDALIEAWERTPGFERFSAILKRDREAVAQGVSALGAGQKDLDRVRAHITGHVLKEMGAEIGPRHFILFKEIETVQVILEDSFGIEPGPREDKIIVPHQQKAMAIVVRCLFGKPRFSDPVEITSFMQFLLGSDRQPRGEQDRIMRYKSMIWFVYLALDLVEADRENVCYKGLQYFRSKFEELLERAVQGKIIDEDSAVSGFEAGKWDGTLFGWLQGEDRKPFAIKLKRQFNFDNSMVHANRMLLSEHRRVIFEEAMALFC